MSLRKVVWRHGRHDGELCYPGWKIGVQHLVVITLSLFIGICVLFLYVTKFKFCSSSSSEIFCSSSSSKIFCSSSSFKIFYSLSSFKIRNVEWCFRPESSALELITCFMWSLRDIGGDTWLGHCCDDTELKLIDAEADGRMYFNVLVPSISSFFLINNVQGSALQKWTFFRGR